MYDSIRVSMSLDKTLKCSFLSVVDGLWYNFVGASIFWSNEGGLTNCTPAKFLQFFALVFRHIFPSAADVRLICPYRTFKQRDITLKRLAQPLSQMPCWFLCGFQISMRLHTGYLFQIGGNQIDSDCPFLIARIRAIHNRACLDTEHRTVWAITAKMSHCLVLDVRLIITRLAVRTLRSVRLYLLLEPETGNFIVREHLEQLYQTESFSIPFLSLWILSWRMLGCSGSATRTLVTKNRVLCQSASPHCSASTRTRQVQSDQVGVWQKAEAAQANLDGLECSSYTWQANSTSYMLSLDLNVNLWFASHGFLFFIQR